MTGTAPELMPVLCAQCREQHRYEPSAWFDHVWRIYSLAAAGYPFSRDELSFEEWLALAEMRSAAEGIKYDAE